MSTDKVRADFEAFVKDHWLLEQYSLERNPHQADEYGETEVQTAWDVWQASRATLEIELPEPHDKHDSDDWMYWADQVDAAIKAAGVRIK